jgi:heme exporter protein CcmD
MSAFFAMGGYAWYVWMAYGAAVVVAFAEIAALRLRRRRAFDLARMTQSADAAGGGTFFDSGSAR